MAAKKENNYKLLSDEPILESSRGDHLEFIHSAEVLARAALHTDCPITLGIYGNWGSGKTSLMRLMKQIVEQEGVGENAAVAVWFNAWQYEREEHLVVPLIATIARDIKKRQEQWEKESDSNAKKAVKIMKTGGKKVHDALRSVLYGISMKGKLGVPLLGELEISASMKDMIERYESVTQDTLMARSLYFDAFDELSKLSHDPKIAKPQIVVFVDDLDRCFPEQAVKLLESIKLILHQPKFSFVLGIYPQIIEEFIRNKYASQYPIAAIRESSADEKEFHSRMDKYLDYFKDYLGKIVQVRYDVPERQPGQMQDYIKHLLKDAEVESEFIVEDISEKDLLELIAEVGERSPREIVRKINWLIVKWRISKNEKSESEDFNLLAGLINETVLNRLAKQRRDYEQFLLYLGWPANEDKLLTYGECLAYALEKSKKMGSHLERINHLRKELDAEESATMKSLIDIIDKDEKLCNVLISAPGLRWLADKKHRNEMQKIFQEKEYRQQEIESDLEKGKIAFTETIDIEISEDVEQLLPGLKMIDVEGGTFLMGSDEGQDREKPVHKVKLSNFKISATQVTQKQYETIMKTNPSSFKGKEKMEKGNLPVENVNWNEAMVFCEQLTKKLKGKYKVTLPTEAQWEYAARGGHKAPVKDGVHVGKFRYAGSDNLDEVGWYAGNSDKKAHPVAGKKPNELGLYDLSGNVWEWCLDWFDEKFYRECLEKGVVENPVCTREGSDRVLRGGSWSDTAEGCRSAGRGGIDPDGRYGDVGFRLVFVPQSVV